MNRLQLLLLKPAAQAKVAKTKLFISCCQPTYTCVTENWRKHNSGKLRTVDCTLEPIQRSSIKHSVGKAIPHSNLGQQETPCKLGRSTPWYFKLQWMSCSRSSCCWTLVEADGSSLNWQWLEFELTLYNILSPATFCRWQRLETLIRTKAGHQIHLGLLKLKVSFSSWLPHRRTIQLEGPDKEKSIPQQRNKCRENVKSKIYSEEAVCLSPTSGNIYSSTRQPWNS